MERLIGVLSILLQRETVTAPELAKQFEVARRTIQRDIESLCRAGRLVPGSAHMLIDFSSWYPASLVPKMEQIQGAIEQHRTLRFTYFSPKEASVRTVEPYYLVFHWSAWYLWGGAGCGRLRFTSSFFDADSVLSWVLTFGDKAELLEPEELREQLGTLIETLARRYQRGDGNNWETMTSLTRLTCLVLRAQSKKRRNT